jgi:hypothetical protein
MFTERNQQELGWVILSCWRGDPYGNPMRMTSRFQSPAFPRSTSVPTNTPLTIDVFGMQHHAFPL